ncbi:MAG TPA: alpha/beta fold hydrolase [Thermoanaerobaculia bacterium]
MRLKFMGQSLEVRESGAGRTLVLVHGYPLDGAVWSSLSRRLSDRFRVLKPDLPGRIDNPADPASSMASYADFIEKVVESADSPVGLAGFSMGGYVCFELMKRRPSSVHALALVDTRANADDETGRANRQAAIATVRAEGVGPIAEAMLPKLLSPDGMKRAELVERVRRIILRQSPQTIESDLAAMRDRPDSTDFLAHLAIPTLVVVGEHDTISSPAESRAMSQKIPGARFLEIAGAGHLTPLEKPAAVAQALGDFFSDALPR